MIPAIVAFILTVLLMIYAAARSKYTENYDYYDYFDYKSYKPRIDSSISIVSSNQNLKNRVEELERKLDILTGDDKNDAYRSADNAERYRAMLEDAAIADEEVKSKSKKPLPTKKCKPPKYI